MDFKNFKNERVSNERELVWFPERNLLRDTLNRYGLSATATDAALLLDLIRRSESLKAFDAFTHSAEFAF